MPAASIGSRTNSPRPWIEGQYQSLYGSMSFSRCARADRQRVDLGGQQIGERVVHQSLPRNAVEPDEPVAFDDDGPVRFAGAGVAGMPGMMVAVVDHLDRAGHQRVGETAVDFVGEWRGSDCHDA